MYVYILVFCSHTNVTEKYLKKEEMNKMKKNLYIIIIKWKKIKDKI